MSHVQFLGILVYFSGIVKFTMLKLLIDDFDPLKPMSTNRSVNTQ